MFGRSQKTESQSPEAHNRFSWARLVLDFLKWVVPIVWGAAMAYGYVVFETKDHAEKTYVKKEVQVEKQKSDDERWDEIKRRLGVIETYINNQNDPQPKKGTRRVP